MIEEVLGDLIPDCLSPFSLPAALSNGVVLCKLMNAMNANKIAHIYEERSGRRGTSVTH